MSHRQKIKDTPQWLIDSQKLYRDLYIELNIILRGIDRFFNVENLPVDIDTISEKNFYPEFIIIRDSILRVLSILEVVLPESKKNAYWFSKFAETKFLSDQKRDYLKEKTSNDDDPESRIFLLYDSFVNFKGIISDVLKSRQIKFLSFKNMGDIITKEIRENKFFTPFTRRINPEYDRIESQEIIDVVKSIRDRKLKRLISMSFILLFRQLHCLNCIDITTKRNISISCGLLILTLLRSEIKQLIRFLGDEITRKYYQEINEILNPVVFQFSMELKRVYNQELKNLLSLKNIHNLRGKIENSHGILKNLIEQSIVQIASFFNPLIKGENIFSTYINKLGQSQKLREDIFILHRILSLFEKNLSNEEKRPALFNSLKNYMLYFESFTFRLLRYDDYEAFVKYFSTFNGDLDINSLFLSNRKELSEKIHNFIIFLETTLNHINNRTELRDSPIDTEKTELLLKQYLQ